MNDNFYKDGYYLTLENAKALLLTAERAAEFQSFGIACSLNILAAEECLKAFFLMVKHKNQKGVIKNFKKVFESHRIKHSELKSLIVFQDKVIEQTLQFLEYLKPHMDNFTMMAKSFDGKALEILNSLHEDYTWFQNASQRKLNLEGILLWLDTANDDKNNGLYVGQIGNTWHSPKSFTREKFVHEKKFTETIYEHVKWLDEFYKKVEESEKTFR